MGELFWIALFIVALVLALLLGIALAIYVRVDRSLRDTAAKQAEEQLRSARDEAEKIRKEAELKIKDDLYQKREELNREVELLRGEVREQERRVSKREDGLEEKLDSLLKKEKSHEHDLRKLKERKAEVEKRAQDVEALIKQQSQKLHELSSLNREQAERLLMERLEHELSNEIAGRLSRHEENVKASAEEKARRIVALAINRYAAEHTADTTVSTVDIPSDDMKGRIIGREGRNIRTFEKVTGVDVIVDDTPGVVIVSAFDNIRRETARLALTKLIQDGRIHPTRIEEVVTETQTEMEKHIMDVGRAAVQEANIGPLPTSWSSLLGRLKFRTSYSQNVLNHSLEVAYLSGMMAEEWAWMANWRGAAACCTTSARRPTTRWKAATRRSAPSWPAATARPSRRCSTPSLGHHDDVTIDHIYTVLVASADAISAARPAPAARRWKSTSSGWRSWRPWQAVSPASSTPTPSRPAARCASSPTPRRPATTTR